MNWNPEIKTFIAQYIDENTDRLLLSAHRFPGIDVLFAVDQILARRQLKNKLPEWYENADIVMDTELSTLSAMPSSTPSPVSLSLYTTTQK